MCRCTVSNISWGVQQKVYEHLIIQGREKEKLEREREREMDEEREIQYKCALNHMDRHGNYLASKRRTVVMQAQIHTYFCVFVQVSRKHWSKVQVGCQHLYNGAHTQLGHLLARSLA